MCLCNIMGMGRKQITQADVVRDYQGGSDLNKNLKALLDLRERLRKKGPYGPRSLRRNLNRAIRLLDKRAYWVSRVSLVCGDMPIDVKRCFPSKWYLWPIPLGCVPRWACIERKKPRRWYLKLVKNDDQYDGSYRTKKQAILVAAQFISNGTVPVKSR